MKNLVPKQNDYVISIFANRLIAYLILMCVFTKTYPFFQIKHAHSELIKFKKCNHLK